MDASSSHWIQAAPEKGGDFTRSFIQPGTTPGEDKQLSTVTALPAAGDSHPAQREMWVVYQSIDYRRQSGSRETTYEKVIQKGDYGRFCY